MANPKNARDPSGQIDEERLHQVWKKNYNTPEHYHVKRKEFGHGQNQRLPPHDTQDYGGRENYIGRDYERNVGYRENYDHLHEGPGLGYENTLWRRQEEQQYREMVNHRGKGPRSYQRSDERIREEVHDRLRDDRYVDATHIKIDVSEGEVTLSGVVDDRNMKRHAEDLCEFVLGVKNVDNRLRIRENTTEI